jgi:23S rRNA (uracil1939-C5)-methyltransferase
VEIRQLGVQGDGVAMLRGQPVRLPLGLPGERWLVRLGSARRGGYDAEPLRRLSEVPRAAPPCIHFERCGGCRLQHLPPEAYAGFKRDRIAEALRRRGLGDVEVAEPLISPLDTRRRLRLAWQRTAAGTILGLRERRSQRIVNLSMCPIARPALVRLFEPLRAILGSLAPHGEALLTETLAGVDLGLELADLDLAARQRLVSIAHEHDLARIAIGDEPVVILREPTVIFAGVRVRVPPRSFLQATGEGEAALQAAVASATQASDRVVDLYAGLGTLGLAARAAGATRLHAIEANAASLQALHGTRLPALTVEQRDLDRHPVRAEELRRTDLVLLDPPRAGALASVPGLAQSALPRLVYAACDPGSFARDARLLVDGGFTLERVQPVDQFLWSAEVELVAVFRRSTRGRQRRA